MKLFQRAKDGGPESNVTGYFLCEFKWAFSIVLLKFDYGSRDAYHSHAFNSISWVLKGALLEHHLLGLHEVHTPSSGAILTYRDTYHKVYGLADETWVFSIRGPWSKTWKESTPAEGGYTLTHGRHRVDA